MDEPRPQRRLAAILAADVAGYSRMMEQDETGTLAALKSRHSAVMQPLVASHRGRVVKLMGDGVLAEFTSAVDAVRCALALQQGYEAANADVAPERRMHLRIGINLGEILVDGEDIFGDDVNIAARLEGLADPGGICISAKVMVEVAGEVAVTFTDMGEQMVKNIGTPLRVYKSGGVPGALADAPAPGKPAIAVLAFRNMSGDPEQEYFADGVVEDIIAALSRMNGLAVISRNSSFSYKGRAVDIRQIARELGVRYVLEGSIRKAGARLRITAQLINAASGATLWADRYEGGAEDVFALQDQVTASVAGAIFPELEQAEIARAKAKPTSSLDTYDHYLHGTAHMYHWTESATRKALGHFYQAIALDPSFAAAHGAAARCHVALKAVGVDVLTHAEIAEAERLARRAVELSPMDEMALTPAAEVRSYIMGDSRGAIILAEQALAINPNLMVAWQALGWAQHWNGKIPESISSIRKAMALSPQDPGFAGLQAGLAFGLSLAGQHDEAILWAERALAAVPEQQLALHAYVASLVHSGRQAEAEQAAERLAGLYPDYSLTLMDKFMPYDVPDHRAYWFDALGRAGMPG